MESARVYSALFKAGMGDVDRFTDHHGCAAAANAIARKQRHCLRSVGNTLPRTGCDPPADLDLEAEWKGLLKQLAKQQREQEAEFWLNKAKQGEKLSVTEMKHLNGLLIQSQAEV